MQTNSDRRKIKKKTFIINDVFTLLKYDGSYNLLDFHTIRKAQIKVCGKTRSMSISQAREVNNNKEFTILRLRNISRKES